MLSIIIIYDPYQNRTDANFVKESCTNRYTKGPLF